MSKAFKEVGAPWLALTGRRSMSSMASLRLAMFAAMGSAIGSAACGSTSTNEGAPRDAGSDGTAVVDAAVEARPSEAGATGVLDAGASDGRDGLDAADGGAGYRLALSVSPFTTTLLGAGVTFSDGPRTATTPTQLQKLYVAHGSTEVFVRVATEMTPPAGSGPDHSYTAALARAALARSLALPLNPELGLWADYGDVTCQPPPDFSPYPSIDVPGPWNTLTLAQMVPVLRAYGTLMAHALLDAGTTVRIWDIGNEIDFGTAGVAPQGIRAARFRVGRPGRRRPGHRPANGRGAPADARAARVAWLSAHVWPNEAKIIAAVADGIIAVDPNARFATHISQATDTAFAQAFYARWSRAAFGSTSSASRTTRAHRPPRCARRRSARRSRRAGAGGEAGVLGGVRLPGGADRDRDVLEWNNALPSYALTPAGQAEVLHDLASWGVTAGPPRDSVLGARALLGWAGDGSRDLRRRRTAVLPSRRRPSTRSPRA